MFQKPNLKKGSRAAAMGAGFIAGAKAGDGLATLFPDSMSKYKKWLLLGIGIVGAASVKSETTGGAALQSAFLGLGAKQGYDAVNEILTDSVDPQDSTTTTGKFLNAIIGHKEADAALGLDSYLDWKPADENFIAPAYYQLQEPAPLELTGV